MSCPCAGWVVSRVSLRKSLYTWLLSLSFSAVPSLAAPVVTTVAEDSFSYANNISLVGQNGGTGWTGAWVSDSISFTDFFTNSVGLSVPGLAGAGGKVVYRAGSQLNDAARDLPLQNSGVLFVQFVSQFGSQSGGGTPNLRFINAGVTTGAVGNNGACGSPVYAILDNTLQPVAGACSTVALNTLSAVVLRIDYTANLTQMWVLSSLSGFDYLNPPAPSASYAGLSPAFQRIAFYSRSPASIDELKVFRVTAPPSAPSPVPGLSGEGVGVLAALLALAAVWRGASRFRRR